MTTESTLDGTAESTQTALLSVARISFHEANLTLRVADVADEPLIRSLFKTAHAADFAAILAPPMLDKLLDQQFHAQAVGYGRQFPDAVSFVIARDQEPIGRVILQALNQGWHIIDILLLPAARGRGTGSAVINAVARAAREGGKQELTLSVLASNAGARRLYARLGFVETGGETHVAMAMRL